MLLLLSLLSPALAGQVFLSVDEARALMDRGAVVIDARGWEPFAKGHVAGAVPLSWTRLRDGMLKVGRLTDDMGALQKTFRLMGLADGQPVLVYDAGIDGWGEAGRIWWTLDYLGHEPTYILDGGLPAWQAAGKPVVEGGSFDKPDPGDFVPHPDETVRARLSEVERELAECQVGRCDVVFWDTREDREYAGETPYGEARGGHLPGAVGLHFADLLAADGTLLPQTELRSLLARHGITPDKQVIAYCTGGVRSGFAAAMLTELGYDQAANYDGSMWEWSADADRPLE